MSITDLIYLSQKSLRSNILRSILTSLGIIIGVSSVITMISIGSGARIEVEQQIERFGSNNLIVRSQSSSNRGVSMGANSVNTSVNFSIVGKPPRPCINNASKLTPSAQGIPTNLFREHNGNFVESYLAKTSSIFEATEAKKLSFSIFDITSFIASAYFKK